MSVLLGIDIGGTNIKLAVVSRSGRLVARDAIETRAVEGPGAAFRRIRDRLPELSGRKLVGAGIGCAGLVDPRSGRILESPNLPTWAGSQIRGIAKRALGVYTIVDNDANCAAYGEYRRGCGRGAKLLICITLGTGVGGSVICQGKVLRGAGSYAGEIGHMTVSERGPRCKCGNRGCLEAYIGADALVAHAKRLVRTRTGRILRRMLREGVPLTPQNIARAARKKDRAALEVFDTAAGHLGTAMASLVNVFNPDVICVAGGVAKEFGLMRKKVREVIIERAFTDPARIVKIRRAELGNNAAPVGAAIMAHEAMEARP